MINIFSRVKNQDNKPKIGKVCSQKDDFTFDDLVKWVYKNCKGYQCIEVEPDKYVYLYYEDVQENYRQEYWSLDEKILKDIR